MKLPIIPIIILILFFCIQSCKNGSDLNKKAEKYLYSRNFENALTFANEAIKIEPDSTKFYITRMIIYDYLSKYKEEILDINKIIELRKKEDKSVNKFYFQRANLYSQLGKYNESNEDLDYLINNQDTIPVISEVYLKKAFNYYMLSNNQDALRYFNLAEYNNSNSDKFINSNILVGKAKVEMDQNRNKNSINLLIEALNIDPSNSAVYQTLGEVYYKLEKYDESYINYERAVNLKSEDPNLYINFAILQSEYKQDYDKAINNYSKGIELNPFSPQVYFAYMNLAIIYNIQGRNSEALENISKALSLNSNNANIFYNYAIILSEVDRNQEALEKIEEAIKIEKFSAEFHNTKGNILMDLNLIDDAIKEFKYVTTFNPKYGGAYYNLGYIFGKQKNPKESIKWYNKAVSLNFDLESTLVNRALQKIQLDQKSSACDDLKRAFKLGRKDIEPYIQRLCN